MYKWWKFLITLPFIRLFFDYFVFFFIVLKQFIFFIITICQRFILTLNFFYQYIYLCFFLHWVLYTFYLLRIILHYFFNIYIFFFFWLIQIYNLFLNYFFICHIYFFNLFNFKLKLKIRQIISSFIWNNWKQFKTLYETIFFSFFTKINISFFHNILEELLNIFEYLSILFLIFIPFFYFLFFDISFQYSLIDFFFDFVLNIIFIFLDTHFLLTLIFLVFISFLISSSTKWFELFEEPYDDLLFFSQINYKSLLEKKYKKIKLKKKMYYFNSYFSYINSLTFLYNKFTLLQVRLILNFIKIQQKYEREIINNFFFFYSFLNTFFLNFIFYKNNINYLFPLKQNYLISIYSFDLLFYHFIYSFSFIYNSHDKWDMCYGLYKPNIYKEHFPLRSKFSPVGFLTL